MNRNFNFKEQMAVNVKWMSFAQIINYALQFIVWVILARLLPPKSFGALGIALAFTNLILIFNELGLSSAIIQKRKLNEEDKITTFWISVIAAIFFLFFAITVSPLLTMFFDNQAISPLVIIFSVKIFIDSFGVVQIALLKRRLNFKSITRIEIFSSILFVTVTVVMAFNRFGIISIAYGYLAKSLLRVAMLWKISDFHPRFALNWSSFNELFGYGRNIVGFKMTNYLANVIDIFLIGRFLGTASLGYYSLALSLINFPRQKISSILSQVAFPMFSKLQDYIGDIRNAYLKLVRYTAAISFPLLFGLLFISPQFVKLVYSSKWDPMILPLQVLCIYGICFSITTFIGVVFNSTGRPEYSFRFSLILLAGTTLAVLSGLKYGLVGIAIALSIFAILANIFGNLMVCRITKANFISYISAAMPALFSSGVMAVGLLSVIWIHRHIYHFSDVGFLCLTIPISMIIYVVSFLFFGRQTFIELLKIFRSMFKVKNQLS